MDAEAVDQGFELLLRGVGDHEQELRELCAVVRQELEIDSSGNVVFPALDRSISTKGGGFAFQWADVLDIGELCETLVKGKASEFLLPNQLATVAVTLLKTWQRLRKVRVELNEDEFKVLLAVKRGNHDITSISKFADLQESSVNAIVADLKNRDYQERATLLEETEEGALSTQF